MGPHVSGTERTERTTDEIGRHEDGVGTVGSLRNLLQAATLIAELLTLQSDIYQDDGCDESCVGVAEEEGYCPGDDLHGCSEEAELVDSEPWNQLSYAAGCHGSHDSAESEHSHHIAACIERRLGKMEGEARPYRHHASETEGGTDGVDADGRMEDEDLSHGSHQSSVSTHIVALHLRHHQHHDSHADHHDEGGDEEHLPPSQPFADVTADYSRGKNTREQSGEHKAHVPALVFGCGELSGYRDEELGNHGTGADEQGSSPEHPYVLCHSHHDCHQGCNGHVHEDEFLARKHISHRDEKEQSQRITYLGNHGDEVGALLGNAQIVADQFEKRLVVVAVGYCESCDDRHHQENAAGNALIFF